MKKKGAEIIIKIKDDFEKVKEIINDNILSYFDFQIDEEKENMSNIYGIFR